jgi:hypothetical protein
MCASRLPQLLLGGLVLLGALADADAASPWLRLLGVGGNDAPAAARPARAPRLSLDEERENPFEKATLLAGIRSGREKMHAFDSEGGATSPGDARSKFVVVSDHLGGDHYLAIPTPNGPAPSSLYAVHADGAEPLGRMWRAMLTQRGLPSSRSNWSAWVHLPGSAAIDILHVHGTRARGESVADWPGYVQKHGYTLAQTTSDYQLYVHPQRGPSGRTVVAIGDARLGRPGALTRAGDGALGRMLLAVAAEAKRRGIRTGKVAVHVSESRVVVRTEGGYGDDDDEGGDRWF